MTSSLDPEVQLLASISAVVQSDYTEESADWKGSPFAWIRKCPSRRIGAIGEKLVAGWLAARGFDVTRSKNSDADRMVENKAVEIKFSTLWEKGFYKFQQLRDQDYDIVVCLGVSPFDAHCWAIEKAEVLRLWRETREIPGQHARGEETAWMTVYPNAVPDWLASHGGTLRAGLVEIARLTGFNPQSAE